MPTASGWWHFTFGVFTERLENGNTWQMHRPKSAGKAEPVFFSFVWFGMPSSSLANGSRTICRSVRCCSCTCTARGVVRATLTDTQIDYRIGEEKTRGLLGDARGEGGESQSKLAHNLTFSVSLSTPEPVFCQSATHINTHTRRECTIVCTFYFLLDSHNPCLV